MRKAFVYLTCLAMISTMLTACKDKTVENNDDSFVENHQEDVIPDSSSQEDVSTEVETISTEQATETVSTVSSSKSSTVSVKTTAAKSTATTAKPSKTTVSTTPSSSNETHTEAADHLNSVQENSIAWLNYLALLSQEINSSKNSRMYLEEAYAALINNTNPENVNQLTESHLVSLLDIIEKYRMIAVKRERLQYIYEQNKAKAIKEAIPDPIALLSATKSYSKKQLIAAVIYMAIDSYTSYQAYSNEIKQEYLKDGWALDDEASENLHDSRKRAFTYMIDIVRENNLPGNLALNENDIEKFVKCKNNNNTHQQIQFLESNKSTYNAFGDYWLLLAECYYNNEQYQECLDSVNEYEKLHSGIFRKDYNLARILPLAITAADEVKSDSAYIDIAEKYLEMIIKNTENDDWALRYFAATTYADLYTRTQKRDFLNSAYDLALNNVNALSEKQSEINSTYIADVKKISIPADATKAEKKKIENYNEALEEKREKELPEIYEPLAINCDLLFSIADKLDLSQSEKDRIDGILDGNGTPVFIVKPVRNQFSFRQSKQFIAADFDKDTLTLPVSCVSDGAKIKVTVSSNGMSIVYDDWKIAEVIRPKGSKNDFSKFKVVYTSEHAENCTWHYNSEIKVEIDNGGYANCKPYVINFRVSNYKDPIIGWDTVEFEQVDK